MHFKIFLLFAVFLLFFSCSQKKVKESTIEEKSLELQVLEAYEEGMEALTSSDILFAAKKFNEAEMLFPQSEWAPKSALMAAYSYYKQDYYADAVAELNRFLKVYPKHKYLPYAYYLLGVSYYEQIVDEKKDSQSILSAKNTFLTLVNKFPNTEYALDAQFKLDMINDILAAKEMYIGRYYFDKKKWIAAINRFRTVVDNFDQTIYVEEALHRLVEVHYKIGLNSEAKKYANTLGYNYLSSEWYKESYKIFNKDYSFNIKKKNKETDKKLLDKIKSFF